MASSPQIGIVITGDSSELIAAADAAQKKLAEMSGKTVQQMQKDSANILKDAKRNQWQQFQLYQQLQDVGLQIAGGQNPLLAMAQQGSQLTAIYGNVGNALKAVGGAVVGFVTSPVALAAAAVGGFGYAMVKGDQQSAEFRKSLALTGNAAGLTESSFNSLYRTIAETTSEGAGHVREFAQAMVTSGRFGSDGLSQFITVAVNMASATGASVDATVQSLTAMKDAPARWAAEHNKQLHFMTDAQLQYVTRLEAFGGREKAVQVVREELLKKFPKVAEENLGYLEATTKKVGGWFSDMWDKILDVGRTETLESKIAKQKDIVDRLSSFYQKQVNPYGYADAKKSAETDLRMLQSKQGADLRLADWAARSAAIEQEKTENRLLAERLQPARDGLHIAIAEYKARQSLNGIETELLRIKLEAANYESPEIQAYYAKVVASKELLKIETQRKEINAEMDVLKNAPANTPEQAISNSVKSLELQGKLNDLNASKERINIQLKADLNGLSQKQILMQYERQKQLEDEIQSIADLNRAAMLRRSDIMDQYKASQFVNPEEGRYYLEKRRIQKLSAEAEGRIGGLKDVDQEAKAKMLANSQRFFDGERDAVEKIHLDNLDKQYNAQRGVNDAIKDYQEASKQGGIAAYNAVNSVIGVLEDTLTTAITKGKLDFSSLTDHIIAEVVRMKIVKPMINSLFDFGSDSGGGLSSILGNLFGSAKGNAFGPSGVIPFAKGGVVNRPTIFPFAKGTGLMGEAGPEAIMPLGRDNQGRLGVRGGGSNVQVNIINNAGAQVTQTQRQDGDTTFIDVMVNQIEDRIAGNVASGSGSVYHAIGNTFGMRRAVS
jgi:lambda family phage tail tape measure protein